MSQTQLPESDFISKFLTLATLSESSIPSNFQKPQDEITTLGVALPPLRYRYNPAKSRGKHHTVNAVSEPETINVTLKSIRHPKFILSQEFSSLDTVSHIKKFLLDTDKIQEVGQVKLLLKGKVLHDNTLLSELNLGDTAVTVVISKPSGSGGASGNVASVTPVVPTPEVPEVPEVPMEVSKPEDDIDMDEPEEVREIEMPWDAIESLLIQRFGNSDDVNVAMERLRKGWELAKQ